jgi:serine/threonine-protein kinase RsbT
LPITVQSRQEMKVESEDDVVLVRRFVRGKAEARGFDMFATAAITTATSELTRNIVNHAGKGSAVVEEVLDGERIGVRVTFRDQGPGIADLERVLGGGYSTARSMGLGLSGSRRLVDRFEIESTIGAGTQIQIVKWKPF